jgi:hypothetical protein
MGHSDIDTTRQYLDPDEALKRKAVNRLSIAQKLRGEDRPEPGPLSANPTSRAEPDKRTFEPTDSWNAHGEPLRRCVFLPIVC